MIAGTKAIVIVVAVVAVAAAAAAAAVVVVVKVVVVAVVVMQVNVMNVPKIRRKDFRWTDICFHSITGVKTRRALGPMALKIACGPSKLTLGGATGPACF